MMQFKIDENLHSDAVGLLRQHGTVGWAIVDRRRTPSPNAGVA
jgi:hypothetical protein